MKILSSSGAKKPKKKKTQFSKIVVIFAMILVTWTVLGDQVLLWFGREPLGETARAVIALFGAFIVGGYFSLQGVRDTSLNRHKLHLDENDKHFIKPISGTTDGGTE
jgi:hypothetical protein